MPASTAVAVSMPVAVNCWVWPTEMVGSVGATAIAWAETSPMPKATTRTKTASGRRRPVLVFIFRRESGTAAGERQSGGTLDQSWGNPSQSRPPPPSNGGSGGKGRGGGDGSGSPSTVIPKLLLVTLPALSVARQVTDVRAMEYTQ